MDIMRYSANKASSFQALLGNLLHHRKQQRGNISCSVLKSISSHLFDCLQGMYWDRENWKELKVDVEKLAQAIAKYTSHLQKSSKKTFNWMYTSPIRQISDNLTFQFLPVCCTSASTSTTCDLHEQLNGCSNYHYLQVEQYCPMAEIQSHERNET